MTGPLERRAARVLLVDDDGRILLQHCHDPSAPSGGSWWNTTGGGLDEGETAAQALTATPYALGAVGALPVVALRRRWRSRAAA